jgi:NAD(P)-dependent dehydrogenase (short-subunit alcohol dehydrogenase family)
MKGFDGKRVFISGGCGDIGRATAARFVDAGARVVLADLLPGKKGARISVSLHPSLALYVRCDVASPASIARAMRFVEGRLGGLDIAICCAGTVTNEPFLKIRKENWDRTLKVNLTGSLLVAQSAARLMAGNSADEAGNRGTIIFTGSWVQKMPWPEGGSYCASKAGQEMLMKVIAQELAPVGITCNLVAPGIVYAGLSRRIYDRDKTFRKRVDRTIPLGRLASADAVAGAFFYLAGPDAAYMTGTSIVIDGGASLVRRDV